MNYKFDKTQKILISASILWELWVLAHAESWAYHDHINTISAFIYYSLPVVIYWLVSWMYGLKWPINLLNSFKSSNPKETIKELKVEIKKELIFLAKIILGVILFIALFKLSN